VSREDRLLMAQAAEAVEQRLVAYRCAALTGLLVRETYVSDASLEVVTARAEACAHAMLAAEREPGASDG